MTWAGPGVLTEASAVAAWRVDVPAVVVLVLAAAAYLAGVLAVQRAGHRWPVARSVYFALGMAVFALATCSFVGVYARDLFWVFSLQVCLVLLVAPLLLAAGAPVALAAEALPPRLRGGFDRVGRSWLARLLRKPGVGPLLLLAATMTVFFTPVLTDSLRHAADLQLLHLTLAVVGVVMAVPLIDEGVGLSSTAYAAMLGLGFVEFMADAIPGIVLRLHNGLVAAGYWASLGRPWGPTPIGDQHLAGSILWFVGEVGDLPLLAVIVLAWIRADRREADQIDRALDAALAAAAPVLASAAPVSEAASAGHAQASAGHAPAVGPAVSAPAAEAESGTAKAEPDGVAKPVMNRPWWETDPSVFGEERARRNGWRPRA